MPRPHFVNDEPATDLHDYAPSGVLRLYLIAIGITILLGLVSGSIWIAWYLIRLHLLHW